MKKAAIVIGVNKVHGLSTLKGAVTDAKEFGDWLSNQGADVTTIIDDAKPVRRADVFKAVKGIVDLRTYDQLVIYFAGHGLQVRYSEIWLLSDATSDAAEAIDLNASTWLARNSGLKNVTFISDCCRSLPKASLTANISGNSIFPNSKAQIKRSEIDCFYATLPMYVAVETANDDGRKSGIFTSQLMAAHKDPPDNYVSEVSEGGNIKSVIFNRELSTLVKERVLTYAKEIDAEQVPDAIIESGKVYIGYIQTSRRTAASTKKRTKPTGTPLSRTTMYYYTGLGGDIPMYSAPYSPSPAGVIAKMLKAAIRRRPFDDDLTDKEKAAIQGIGFMRALERYKKVDEGAISDKSYVCVEGEIEEIYSGGSDVTSTKKSITAISTSSSGSSVAVKFKGGGWALLPILHGYVGHLFAGENGIEHISYLRWSEERSRGNRDAEDVRYFRGLVAAATQYGVFRIPADSAQEFADRIRLWKWVDPTLGLYASYAYAMAGLSEKVESVREYMLFDTGVDIFDLSVLSSKRKLGSTFSHYATLPSVPMLRQGWAYVDAIGHKYSESGRALRGHLTQSLWTSFDEKAEKWIIKIIDEA